jgi:endonuclease G, mitochondrial
MPTKRLFPALLALCALPLGAALPAAQEPKANPHVRFGLPAPAEAKASSREAYLIERPQYVLSYNAKTRNPNWVSWRLRKEDIGGAARGKFQPDPLLPKGFAKVAAGVYTGSGFDRGHQCLAKDRSATQEDCDATFYTTNIVPQSPASNQRGWERMEDYCRRLAKGGSVLYISCGPHGVGGEGKNGPADEIGKGKTKVTVPSKLWKVVLVLPGEDAEPRKNSRVIAVIMPNDQSVDFNWAKYRVKASKVEKLTGHRFFRNVPEEVASELRDHLDTVKVAVPKGKKGKKGQPD